MFQTKKNLKQSCSFPAEVASTREILNFFENWLLLCYVNKKVINEYRLVIEEACLKLIENAPKNSVITIEGRRSFRRVILKMSCPGSPVNLITEEDPDLGSLILEQYHDHFKQSYLNGTNTISFFTGYQHYIQIGSLLAFLLSALTAFLLFHCCSESVRIYLLEGLFYPLCEIYASYMEVLAIPVVFFSIIVMVVRLRLEFERHRDMAHIFLEYLCSSLLAILISYLFTRILLAMDPAGLESLTNAATFTYETETGSKLKVFMNQFVFKSYGSQLGTPIQVILLALVVGYAVSSSFGSGGTWLRKASFALNGLFSQLLSILYCVIPVFLYFALLSLWIYDGIKLLMYILLPVLFFSLPLMILLLVYSLQLAFSGISPVRFLREYKEILWENVKIASNIDALPYNNRALSRKLSMSSTRRKDILSIGAIANMDGNCLLISVFTFVMCVVFKVRITPQLVINIFLIILVISIGAPNQPGSFLISLIFIMNYLGVTYEYYDYLIVTECVLGIFYSSLNSIGDIVFIVVADQWFKRRRTKAGRSD